MTEFRLPISRTATGFILAVLMSSTSALAQTPRPRPDTGRGVIINPPETLNPAEDLPATVQWFGRTGIRQELIEADRLSAQGRFQEVVDFLLPVWNAELNTRPDEAIVQALKRAYRSLKDYGGMRVVIRQQLDLNPQNPIAQADLAEAFFSDNMTDSGRATLERMIVSDPQDRERHHLAAQTYMRIGRYNEGLDVWGARYGYRF